MTDESVPQVIQPNRGQRRHPTASSDRTKQPTLPKQVSASYIKSAQCRLVHADGAFGGPTPNGLLYIALFSEHAPLPPTTVYSVDAAAKALRQLKPIPHENQWVREVEGEVIMSLDAARSFRDWLNERITMLEQVRSAETFVSVPPQV